MRAPLTLLSRRESAFLLPCRRLSKVRVISLLRQISPSIQRPNFHLSREHALLPTVPGCPCHAHHTITDCHMDACHCCAPFCRVTLGTYDMGASVDATADG